MSGAREVSTARPELKKAIGGFGFFALAFGSVRGGGWIAALGMTGKAAIHPKQIPVINQRFTPTAEAIARARRTITAFEASDGGLVVVDGKLIEKPVLRAMYRTLAIADRVGG